MKTSFDATGEVLVVTGGANGIGAALARAFAEAGGRTAVFDVAPGPEVKGLTQHEVDVSDRDAVFAVFAAVGSVLAQHGLCRGGPAANGRDRHGSGSTPCSLA